MSLSIETPATKIPTDARAESLGTILVASSNPVFAAAVGYLVAESGFAAVFPVGLEAPWLSIARTQPRVVICDFDAPVKRWRRLVGEASALSVPLLMAHTAKRHGNPLVLARIKSVAWQRFPVSANEFRRMLEHLAPPDSDRGVPHHDAPNAAERQYRRGSAQTADST